jgi:hypothetical protein
MSLLRYITLPAAALFGIGLGAAPALADTGIRLSDDLPQAPSDGEMLDKIGQDIAATAYHPVSEVTPIVADTELAKLRGGFAIGGLNITMGADIKTFINDQLALHTTMSWGDQAISETHVLSGALTMADAGSLRNQVLASGNISMQIGNNPVFLTNNGQTVISHRTDGALQNILVNTASNVNVRQEVNATLDVGGYAGFATNIQNVQMSNLFSDAINSAVVSFGR